MSAIPSTLEIRIHLVNGKVEKFVQDDPQAIAILLTNIQPAKLFSQPHLVIAGKYSMTLYSCSAITMVELVMDGFPDWTFPLGIEDIRQITEEEFWQRFRPEEDQRFVREQPRKVGEAMVGFMEIELRSGERTFVELHSKVPGKLDQLHVISQLASAPCLYSRRMGGGVSFVNPANIVRFTFNPGPPETSTTAWPAHHKPSAES